MQGRFVGGGLARLYQRGILSETFVGHKICNVKNLWSSPMASRIAFVLSLSLPLVATNLSWAETYKCVVGGKSVYSDTPCASNAARVDAGTDQVSQQQQLDRLRLSIKERQQRNAIEGRQEADFQAQQRQLAAQSAAERVQEANRIRNCSYIASDIRANERASARYRDWGMQESYNVQQRELKSNQSAYSKDCR